MSWTYQVTTGNFTDPSGTLQGKGYSGQPPHTNDPDSEHLECLGPIPEGLWKAVALVLEHPTLGPYVIDLEPYPQTATFGRSAFRVHGERIQPPPGFASDGCIIQSRDVRELFWNSTDHDIEVVR